MTSFCEACGSELTARDFFCWKCGVPIKLADSSQQPASSGYERVEVPQAPPTPPAPVAGDRQQPPPPSPNVQFQQFSAPANPAYAHVPAAAPPAPPVPKAGKATWITVVVVIIVIIFVGGMLAVGGMIYIAHRVGEKVHHQSAAPEISDKSMRSALDLDVCLLFNMQEVNGALASIWP